MTVSYFLCINLLAMNDVTGKDAQPLKAHFYFISFLNQILSTDNSFAFATPLGKNEFYHFHRFLLQN